MRNFVSYEKSIELLTSVVLSKQTTQKLFITNALGKVISKDIIADHNSPEFQLQEWMVML